MSSIALGVANLVAGMLWNNVLDHAANRLSDGDSTDEKCREMIVRELEDIKSKLDGLARKDLLSSVSFLSDGICLINLSLEEYTQGTPAQQQTKDTERVRPMAVPCYDDSAMHCQSETSVFPLETATIQALQTTRNIASETERFLAAKSSFNKAYTKATEAFHNEALTTEDRILATKLRVISRILERLEDPDSSAAFCKLYLRQLHDMPAIKKTFSVYFRSGMKSRFHKSKRAQNVKIVMMINYGLFNYAREFTERKGVDDIFDWPRITLAKQTLHPLMLEPDVLTKIIEKCGVRPPNQFIFSEGNGKLAEHAAVNGKGEIIVKRCECQRFDVIDNKGEIRFSFSSLFCNQDTNAPNFEILALTTDKDDDLYVVSRFKSTKEVYNYKVSVADAKGIYKREFALGFLTGPGERHHTVCIAVNKNKDIFITKQDEARVYALKYSRGQPAVSWHSFRMEESWNLISRLCISEKNEIIAAELVGKTVGVYTEEGELRVNIEIPGLHKVCGLAYHYVSRQVLVLTEVMPACYNVYQLQSYSAESGELLHALPLPGKRNEGPYKIISHPRGPVVLVHKTGVIFI